MQVTRSKISKNTESIRRNGFMNDYTYRFESDKYQFEADTRNGQLEIWDKQFDGEYDEYPGQYFSFDGHKKDFVDFVYNFLNN